MAGTTISFNSFSLQDTNYKTSEINHVSPPERVVDRLKLARAHGEAIVSDWYDTRKIIVSGSVLGSTASDLQSKLDAMLKALGEPEANLDIEYGAATRRYVATLERADIPKKSYNSKFVEFKLTFECSDPFGYATSASTLSEAAITTSPNTWSETISGSAPPLPVITITLNSATDVTIIRFKNSTTDDEIIVGATYITGDELEIDTANKTVKLNGTEIDYIGVFPSFDVGSNSLRLEVTATAFNADVDIVYTPTYL